MHLSKNMCRFRPLTTGAQCHGRSTTRKSCTLGDGHCNATNEIFGVLVGAGSGVGVGGRRDWIQDCKVWDLMLECMRVFKLKWYLKLSPTEMFLSAGFWWGERSSSASIGIFYSKKLECLAQMTCRDARIDFCHTTKTASFWTWDNMIQKDKWFGWSLVESQVVYLVFKGSSFMTLGDLWHWNKMICCSTVLYWILYFCRV